MLIDFAPDPGPGVRPARGAVPPAAGASDDAGSFRSVLAQIEGRAGQIRASTDETHAEAAEADVVPDAEEGDVDEQAKAESAAAEISTRAAEGRDGSLDGPDERPEQQSALTEVRTTQPTDPDSETPKTSAAEAPSHDGERGKKGEVAPAQLSARDTPNALLAFQVPAGAAPRAGSPAAGSSAEGGVGLPRASEAALPSRADMRGAAEAPLPAAEPSSAASARNDMTANPPAVPEMVIRARLSEGRLARSGLAEVSGLRAVDGFASALAIGAAEGASLAPGEVTVDRFLRAASPAAADLAREVAQQIGARITPLARGQFELSLAPAELGRLEIVMREIDGVMTLSVSAERAETMDLIRRHVDLLAQELRQIAQRELALHLGAGGAGAGSGGRGGESQPAETSTTPAIEAATVALPPALNCDHLDLRL